MDSILEVSLADIEMSDRKIKPAKIFCAPSCNLVVWFCSISQVNQDERNEIQAVIAKQMDRFSDLLRDYKMFAPLVAAIQVPKISFEWHQLAGDQDWHRGRFIVQIIDQSSNDSIDTIKKRWLGPIRTSTYTPRKIETSDFKKLVLEALDNARPSNNVEPQIFARFSSNLVDALDNNTPELVGQMWQDELMEDLNQLFGSSIFERSNYATFR